MGSRRRRRDATRRFTLYASGCVSKPYVLQWAVQNSLSDMISIKFYVLSWMKISSKKKYRIIDFMEGIRYIGPILLEGIQPAAKIRQDSSETEKLVCVVTDSLTDGQPTLYKRILPTTLITQPPDPRNLSSF